MKQFGNDSESRPADSSSTIREQFDFAPYPNIPLEQSPRKALAALFIHNLVTPYYIRNQQLIETQGKQILDAGCGSGYSSLVLAEANPGARIVGVDISEASLSLARKRLAHHGFKDVEFHLLCVESLPQLKQQFDYINCDETLYLLPDPLAGLKALKAVLKPEGILRTNYHSQLQRAEYFRAQQLGDLLGLTEEPDQQSGIAMFRAAMGALKTKAPLKQAIWGAECEIDDANLLANHLLRGDKGTTVPGFLAMIEAADLAFIRMVNWQSWELLDLFNKPDELPAELAAILEDRSSQEKLHLYELINPNHRLLDVWCGHPQSQGPTVAVADWKAGEWENATIHLHPQLRDKDIRDKLRGSALTLQGFDFGEVIPLGGASVRFDTMLQATLLPLWESPQPVSALVSRWQELHPVNPVTLAPLHDKEALLMVKRMLIALVHSGYLLAYHPGAATS